MYSLAQAKAVFITDCHFKSPSEEKHKLILKLIGSIDPQKTEAFVLLGDVFDFYFGRSAFFRRKFSELSVALKALAESGVKVVFLQGNHEFSLERGPWEGVEIVTSGTKILELSDGTRFALCHGDYLLPKKKYFFYMSLVRSSLFLFIASWFPGSWMDRICLWLSSSSRKRYKPLDREWLKKESRKWLEETGARYGLCGHYHMKMKDCFKNREKEKTMIFIPGWERPNALVFGEKGFELYEFV